MTALTDMLIRRIATSGPISLAEYMADCLLHPEHGYYATRDPFGTQGDFITAPEISQMFGELIGLSLAQAWLDQGAPPAFTLAELGPGRGTLMTDILRATKSVPGFATAAQIHLLEASETLQDIQRDTLSGTNITWIKSVDALPDLPLFLIANEFFDALPIRQFQRNGNGWSERQVGVTDNKLALGLAAPSLIDTLDHRIADTKQGDIVELCPAAAPIMQAISNRIAHYGGAALIIDYGDWHSLGDTFQALQSHASVDPLANPGAADLTAHVDFETLAIAAIGITHSRLTTQGVFLERLGITQRAQALAQNLSQSQSIAHISAHRRLTHPTEMGSLFKVLGLVPNGTLPPPGLEL